MKKTILNPNTITSITPNPATGGYVNVYFTLDDDITEAKLMVYSSSNGLLQGMYALTHTETFKTIDISSYNQGTYLVVLVCDGITADSKNFVKQ
jgi:hypothetical protein